MGLFAATESAAQTPSDPAGAPPTSPAPDAVSGDPAPGESQSVSVPPPPPPPAPPAAPVAATPPPPDPNAPPPGGEEPFSRRGLYLSAGIGTSIINYSLDQWVGDALVYAGGITELVPATMIKVGFGIGPQTAVHFTSRIAWLAHNDPAAVDRHERIWTMSTLTGVGVTHFLDPEQRSVYLGADLGAAHWLAFEDIELDFRDIGIGLCGELGYAFFEGLSFEHSVCWSSVTSYRRGADSGFEIDAELGQPFTATFTLNYLK
jgi:hypothetical protein